MLTALAIAETRHRVRHNLRDGLWITWSVIYEKVRGYQVQIQSDNVTGADHNSFIYLSFFLNFFTDESHFHVFSPTLKTNANFNGDDKGSLLLLTTFNVKLLFCAACFNHFTATFQETIFRACCASVYVTADSKLKFCCSWVLFENQHCLIYLCSASVVRLWSGKKHTCDCRATQLWLNWSWNKVQFSESANMIPVFNSTVRMGRKAAFKDVFGSITWKKLS